MSVPGCIRVTEGCMCQSAGVDLFHYLHMSKYLLNSNGIASLGYRFRSWPNCYVTSSTFAGSIHKTWVWPDFLDLPRTRKVLCASSSLDTLHPFGDSNKLYSQVFWWKGNSFPPSCNRISCWHGCVRFGLHRCDRVLCTVSMSEIDSRE